ncbi:MULTISPECIES: oligosaccharide flippase family protein [unclassified Agarivorans]|uniref:oligosaccharide flippase family protein n=1 Tax=unclassified Agarivorans TaxID=2636026 RepID=UPI0026E279EA|nr:MULTISPECIES: oligosaccharide flippase family protein [unclassified Agarivorans]MDO6687742.1 oligosaccharide flippase family protein [Agarivorans sp. 3_MG-2023]MDO6717257.1 oligosaccharide flippase family protein [Agarivorans sp. 2_MG-2023]
MGKIVTQLLRWAMTFWVIRLLSPDDYGLVAMSDVLFGFLNLLLASLFTSSIIQEKHLSKQSLKQLFGAIILSHVGFFVLQYSLADVAGSYYQSEVVSKILKVNAWCFIILALEVIPAALLAKNMEFKKVSIIAAISNIAAAISTLVMAFMGYGFWALVIGEVIFISLRALLTFAAKPINFLPSFRISDITAMLKFGGMLSIQSVLFYVFMHMDVAIAGRIMSPTEVGLYAIGLQVALMPQKKIMPLLRQVAFPAFSKIQDQPELISKYVLKAQRLCISLTLPIFWGLASVTDLVIPLLLGEKWLGAIVPTTIMLMIMPLRFSEELFNPALKSLKLVNHMLINLSIMATIMFISIIVAANYGAIGLALAWLCGFPFAYLSVAWRNSRALGTQLSHFVKLLVAPMLSGAGMLAAVYALKQLPMFTPIFQLAIQITVGGLCYIGLIWLLDKMSLKEVINLLRKS